MSEAHHPSPRTRTAEGRRHRKKRTSLRHFHRARDSLCYYAYAGLHYSVPTLCSPPVHERGQLLTLRLVGRHRRHALPAAHRADLPHLQLGDARRRRVPDVEEGAEARRREDLAGDLPRGAALLGAAPRTAVLARAPARADLAAAPRGAQRRLAGGNLPLAAALGVVPRRLAPHALGLAVLRAVVVVVVVVVAVAVVVA